MFGSYAPIGGGLMLLCQLGVAILSVLLVLGLLMTSVSRRRHPKYWVALMCVGQPIPLAFILREMGEFSEYFDLVWLASMALVAVGLLVVLWPTPIAESKPHDPPGVDGADS